MVKITRPFSYDLNQIPYDYKVEVTNRFKGLDLVVRVPEELWTEVHNTTGGSEQNHPKTKRNARKFTQLYSNDLDTFFSCYVQRVYKHFFKKNHKNFLRQGKEKVGRIERVALKHTHYPCVKLDNP